MNPTWLYVAALYALAVWLARRARVEIPVRVAVFFYALVLIFLFRPMTQHYVNLPVDIVLTLPPWHNVTPKFLVANFEMNDIVMQIVPWAHQAREAWRHGSFPLWNALAGGGVSSSRSSSGRPCSSVAIRRRARTRRSSQACTYSGSWRWNGRDCGARTCVSSAGSRWRERWQ